MEFPASTAVKETLNIQMIVVHPPESAEYSSDVHR